MPYVFHMLYYTILCALLKYITWFGSDMGFGTKRSALRFFRKEDEGSAFALLSFGFEG